MGLKRCSGCQTEKELSAFSKNKAQPSGVANWCKACHRELYTSQQGKERRVAHRDRNWEHSLVIECRRRAMKRGLPFNLTDDDIFVPDVCPILGIPLSRTRGTITNNTPTADRVIPSLGYVKGNVLIISWKANRLKSDCDDPEVFESIARYIRHPWKCSTGKGLRDIAPESASGNSILVKSAGLVSLPIGGAVKQ